MAALQKEYALSGELPLSESKQAFWCHHRDGYSVIAFPKELATAHMADVREAGVRVMEQLSTVKDPACLVDLTALEYMGSSLVASIVRIWKAVREKNGRMVVVASNDRIADVLRATGLTKVWVVVSTFEAGVHALGFSPEAKVEQRERRLLAWVGPIGLVGGAIAVAIRMIPQLSAVVHPVNWLVYTMIGLAGVASGISTFRETGWRRILSILVFLFSVPLMGLFVWFAEIRIPPLPVGPRIVTDNAVVTPEDNGQATLPSVDNPDEDKQDRPSLSVTASGGTEKAADAGATAETPPEASADPAESPSGDGNSAREKPPAGAHDAGEEAVSEASQNSGSRPSLKPGQDGMEQSVEASSGTAPATPAESPAESSKPVTSGSGSDQADSQAAPVGDSTDDGQPVEAGDDNPGSASESVE